MHSSDEHNRVTALFLAACELSGDERQRFLDEQCAGDGALRAAIEAMLRTDAGADEEGFLAEPALGRDFRICWTSANPPPAPREGAIAESILGGGQAVQPQRIGAYTVLEVIGEGGMGVVYLAEQDAPQRRVALKVIRPGLSSSRMLDRFEHEVQILGRLQHPGIAQIFEAGIADAGLGPQPFFAMEYIEGQSLSAYAKKRGLSVHARLALIAAICDAVHHAHQKGVIHRDLKPGNILVTESGDPKIVDFGVARATDADVRMTTFQTQVRQPIGTLPYMSPEQAAGDPTELDTRSDVYALGVILYELLTERLPIDVRNQLVFEAVRIIREEDCTPLSAVNPAYRGDLNTIVAKALEKDRERRYQSASDLAADLHRFLQNEPIVARRPSTLYRLQKFGMRHRAACLGMTAVLLAILLGIAGTAWQAVAATRQRNRAQAAERRVIQRFEQVRALANHFIFDVHDAIQVLPGATKARALLVKTALEYLNSLRGDATDDVALQQELAEAYIRVGRVQGHASLANLGDTAGALVSFEHARAIRQALLDARPDDSQRQLDLAYVLRMIADVQAATGESKASFATYQRAFTIAEAVLDAEPTHFRANRELADNYRRRGALHARMGETAAALEDLQATIRLTDKLVEAQPDDLMLASALQRSYYELGRIQEVAGLTGEALTTFQMSTEMAQTLCEREPANASFRRSLAVSHALLGDVLNTMGRSEEALVQFEEQLRHTEALAEADPNNIQALQDLGFAYERIAYTQLERGQAADALATFQRGRDARAAAVTADPHDNDAAANLVISLLQVGDAHESLGQLTEAKASWVGAVDRAEQLARDDPANSFVRRLHAAGIERLGNLQRKDGDLQGALGSYQRMFDIAASRAVADPDNTEAQQDLAAAHNRIGDIQWESSEYEPALDRYRQALQIRSQLAGADTVDAQMYLHVANSHERIGRCLATMKQPALAAESYQRAIQIHLDLAAADSAYKPRHADLASTYFRLGEQQLEANQDEEALASFEQCRDLRQGLVDAAPQDAAANLSLVAILERMATAHERLGMNEAPALAVRREHLQQAVGNYERAVAGLARMQKAGLLTAGQAGLLDELSNALTRCRSSLETLAVTPGNE